MRILLLPLLALTACAPVSGIWMVTWPHDDEAITCETTIEENFLDGYVPGDPGEPVDQDWQYAEDYVGADTLSFFQVETTAGGDAVLVIGSAAYPGTRSGGEWVFEWEAAETSTSTATHESGYAFRESSSTSSTLRVTLDRAGLFGGKADGRLLVQNVSTLAWTEDDEWDEDLAMEIGSSGAIPSYQYLVWDDDGDESPLYNEYDVTDCSGDCELSVTDDCRVDGSFTAVRTHYQHEETWTYLQSTGNRSRPSGGGVRKPLRAPRTRLRIFHSDRLVGFRISAYGESWPSPVGPCSSVVERSRRSPGCRCRRRCCPSPRRAGSCWATPSWGWCRRWARRCSRRGTLWG